MILYTIRSLTLVLCLLSIAHSAAAQTTITGADTAGLGSFTDGTITLSPFAAGGGPGTFSANAGFIGIDGGTNINGIDDADGDPTTLSDQESLDIALAGGSGLSQIEFSFTRANAIEITGFASDPLASVGINPNNNIQTGFDSVNGSVLIYHPWQSSSTSQINFANLAASSGQTLTISSFDFSEAAPQAIPIGITYDTVVALVPGDVDGDGDVDLVEVGGDMISDFDIIRDNFLTGTTRSTGDLTGDGQVTLADFDAWSAGFGGPILGLASLLVVPEPSSVSLLCVTLAAVCGLRRR